MIFLVKQDCIFNMSDITAGDILILAEMKANEQKIEEAAALYEKVGAQYKLAEQWNEAGRAFELAAECHVKAKDPIAAATACVAGSTAFIQGDRFDDSLRCIDICVQQYRP